MYNINCNNDIELIRNDKLLLQFRCANYKLTSGDQVIFNVKETSINKVISTFAPNGVATIEVPKSETDIQEKIYTYTIRVVTTSGVDETVIRGNFTIN